MLGAVKFNKALGKPSTTEVEETVKLWLHYSCDQSNQRRSKQQRLNVPTPTGTDCTCLCEWVSDWVSSFSAQLGYTVPFKLDVVKKDIIVTNTQY